MEEKIHGRAWVLGDNVNTDDLHPPSFYSTDTERMKEGILAGVKNVDAFPGEDIDTREMIIVAGENFGCGSSRETSVRALLASGVHGIIARSFARIFYRSMVNLTLPPFVCDTIQSSIQSGDSLEILPLERKVQINNERIFQLSPVDIHFQRILEAGGLTEYLSKEMDS